ncbi:MAG: hypothetical protein ACP5NP_07345 [Acetobacteraceae bacterium]
MDGFAVFDRVVFIAETAKPEIAARVRLRLDRLGGGANVRHEPALATPGDPRIGVLLSHRAALAAASAEGARSVLVLQGDVLFHDRFHSVLTAAARELARLDWGLCHLGGSWPVVPPPEPGCRHLDRPARVGGVHAVAYSARAMSRALADWPADIAAATAQRAARGDLAARLAELAPVLAVFPTVTTLPSLLPFEPLDAQQHFVA